jgi:thioredoxin 1
MKNINAKDFENVTKKGAVVCDFYGVGCQNCEMMEPALTALANENPNIGFYKIDTASAPALAEKFNISSLPTVLFMKDGKVVNTLIGLKPRGVIARAIAEIL